jgi:hypothetical protein
VGELVSWLRLDDRFDAHPKVIELADADAWRWVRVLLYCSSHETDGVVSGTVLSKLGITPRARDRLLELELLEPGAGEGAYRVHDFLAFNPSKADRELERARWKERKRRQRAGAGELLEGEDVSPGVTVGHTVESRPLRAGSVPYPNPQTLVRREAGGDELERATELGVGRLFALLDGLTSAQAEHIRGLALRSSGLELERLTREVGAGVVDPVGYVLERLGRMAA